MPPAGQVDINSARRQAISAENPVKRVIGSLDGFIKDVGGNN
jgi:hypothetical protein